MKRTLIGRHLPWLALLGAACTTVGPDYVAPELQLPDTWSQPREAGLADGAAEDLAWWQRCDDPLLTQLVDLALRQNLDLRAGLVRLQAARALRGVAAAGAWPTLDARGAYEHREESLNTPFGAFIPSTEIHSVGFDAAWELDLWGRVRRSVEAADRDLDASALDVHAAALSVAAEVARAYVDLRAAQRRLQLANENLQLQQRTLELVRARQAAGLVRERDVAQASTNVETTRSRLPQLQAATSAASNRIAVLLGRAPGDLPVELGDGGALPHLPATVAVGTPVDLLRRRPDVRAAERRLAAEVARIGVAEADRYPRFTLSGTFGFASDGGKHLLDGDSQVVGFGPSVRWNLFDGGRLKNRIASLQASAEAAQIAYEQTVLLAIEEAENAMTRFVREQARRDALERAATEARRAVTLAQAQYSEGLSDFQTVLDSERIVATIEDDLASSDATVATELIAVFKALGGGDEPVAVTAAAR
ncbi:MAG: efflux transporter outer membrane subunit [Planctomycetes bacterium]|nr:efflux transporter outer membrane subunit [Planctomycetota bacterium]